VLSDLEYLDGLQCVAQTGYNQQPIRPIVNICSHFSLRLCIVFNSLGAQVLNNEPAYSLIV
jgi:hypothetical protein